MGDANKLLLEVKGKPMMLYVVEAVIQSNVDECIVVVGHEAEAVQQALSGVDVQIVLNPNYEQGMSTSIRAGVQKASEQADGYMICLSDMPFITSEEYNELLDHFHNSFVSDPNAILVPMYEGQRGNPVIISTAFKSSILANQGTIGCRSIVKQHPQHVSFHNMSANHVTLDIDTPAKFASITASQS